MIFAWKLHKRSPDQLGIERVVKDYHELLEDREIDGADCNQYTDTHEFIVRKQVFCEKPLALNLADIDDVMKTVDRTGVKLQVGYNRRFDKSFQHVRHVVTSGDIGHPCTSSCTSPTVILSLLPWNMQSPPGS